MAEYGTSLYIVDKPTIGYDIMRSCNENDPNCPFLDLLTIISILNLGNLGATFTSFIANYETVKGLRARSIDWNRQEAVLVCGRCQGSKGTFWIQTPQ
ncbi:MAG: hypothetical protein US11_C0003G0040 [Candidatus Roizmanbacteria bacterium GW2011_GWA2_36_23]|uniref:Uncharacterized protein n=1 Tax=Candidatus Roizmanbacteria bacterium GW2011_GWA2_36_23 TaxID=1618480 RepID=A0A0G0E8Q8_9BACT|nr:MAG: hypothetical protein US11_C0003G0040 [Candidatus Roizmanbacteria bacterium GW2011_GWA2_36_23]